MAQEDGWRADLWEFTKVLAEPEQAGGDRHAAFQRAIEGARALRRESSISDADMALADSVLMELHAAEAYLYERQERSAQAVLSYRASLEHAAGARSLERTVAIASSLAGVQARLGDANAALRTLDDVTATCMAVGDTLAARRALLEKSYLCRDQRLFAQAIDVNRTLLAIDEARHDDRGRIGTELALSRCYESVGSPQAFVHARNAYKLSESTGHEQGLLDATERLIASYDVISELDSCRIYVERALAKAQARGVPADIAKFENGYGRFFMRSGKFDEAIEHLQRGLAVLAGPGGAPNALTAQRLGALHQDLGTCYLQLGDRVAAKEHLLSSDSLSRVAAPGSVNPWADLGEIYLSEGDEARAIAYGERALAQGRAERDLRMTQRASRLLYTVHKRRGETASALAMHELYFNTSDSLGNESYKLGLLKAQLDIRHQEEQLTDSLRAEVREQGYRAEIKTKEQRTRFLVIGGVVLFIGAAFVAFLDRKRRLARFEKDAAQLETQALRSQMNPHFIFNALNSINSFVQRNDPDRASSFLSKFARLMRLVLENSRRAEVPLKDDLEALDLYLQLERSRSGDKFDFIIQVAPDLDPEEVMVPPLVAQPFVENAIWHGMAGKTEKGRITLSVAKTKEELVFTIEDDGVGRNAPKQAPTEQAGEAFAKKTSLGTAITRARLDLVQQQKGKPAGFRYIDLPQGTRVELTLPMSTA